MDPFNQAWAGNASALIFLLSDTLMPRAEDRPESVSRYNSFDSGAAWAQIALQATASGYAAHAMAGLRFDDASRVLRFPDRFRLEIGIAIGRRADGSRLPDQLKTREVQSGRMALEQLASAGPFPGRLDAIAAE
ncbi:MAG: nitroreductase family protein [Pseudomonadota bacterium]